MTFGEKLKKLRTEHKLTQDELAERIYVTRTAISKWETDKGYPSIDSLKQLSSLFGISIDALISDADIENKQHLEQVRGRKLYWCAMACFALTLVSAIITAYTDLAPLKLVSIAGMIGYMGFALLSNRYARPRLQRGNVPSRVISLLVLLAVAVIVIVTTFLA
ncbi:MAG: helix-turn-helix transcriptional regulator [Clostridia bacterium]|nr:helix-turn-helix transcriptional regulator [Clostridia bacterium]